MRSRVLQLEKPLGRYHLLEALGAGAFGTVYRAQDTADGSEVALKILTQVRPAALSRFKQEFRALRDLNHPNLVRMHELFEHEGQWVIAMQLVRGHGFLEWVRPDSAQVANSNGAVLHEARLRAALDDLTQGLCALHRAGLLHRDLKPANIRVTTEGKAMLLDFGLVTGLDPDAQSTHAGPTGTAAYMAPEQAASLKLGSPADWYALGVCLYEALTGRLPFEAETSFGILMAKQGKLPPPPSQMLLHTAAIPTDLEALCMQLLEPDPSKRAGAQAIVEVLSGPTQPLTRHDSSEWSENTSTLQTQIPGGGLQGRETELHLLNEAFRRTQDGQLRMVLVEGESGIGKSTLVEAFVRKLPERYADALVLRGRCYENEQVPYKAFDGCMDDLTRVLKRLPKDRCEALMPTRAALIAQLFPVLGVVPAIAKSSLKGASAEPNARRLEAFQVLCDLFDKLAVQRPLVLVIDDVQWADAESFRLLKAIVADAPPLLVVFTVRPLEEIQEPVHAEVLGLRGYVGTDVISLKGLPPEGTRALATQLLGSAAKNGWMNTILNESQGHPLFIDALAQYAASHDVRDSGSLSLEVALAARIESVGESSRRLLDLIALAAKPHDRQLFAKALGAPFDEALSPLLARKLARTRGPRLLVCFHDSVRSLVVRRLGQGLRIGLHRALATALSQHEDSDPAEAAFHWEHAGEHARAAEGYERAASTALEALAFTRAADLYLQALALLPEADRQGWLRLTVQRGHALARGGRSADAAALYQAASRHAAGEERVRLGICMAQHLLQSAQVEPGLVAARALLSELGMGLPTSDRAALARLVWDRARMRMRGLSLKPLPAKGVDPRTALQLEAAWQLGSPLAAVDILPGANLSAAHLRRALDAGDPKHATRALAHEASMRAVQKPFAVADYQPLLETSRKLAEQVGDPALDAFVTWVEGMTMLHRYEFLRALEPFHRAEQLLREQCPDEPWLLSNVRLTLGAALAVVGEHRSLAQQSHTWLAEAREREDRFAETTLFGMAHGFLRLLMEDEPDAALAELERTMAPWPREPFSTNAGMGELQAIAFIEPYRGGPALQRWLERERPRLDRAFVLRAPALKPLLPSISASAAIGAAAASSDDERKRFAREARKHLAPLKREHGGPVHAGRLFMEAQLLALEGNLEVARERATSAVAAFDGLFQRHAAAYLQGLLEGGEAGRERCEAAIGFFREQGWKRPERAIEMLVPVLPLLQAPEPTRVSKARPVFAGRYEVLDILGQGGYGSVTGARDVETGRRVAIKELTRTSPQALYRFKQEFRALQALRHPRLVRLDALFEREGSWFIAMPWVEGTDLRRWVRPAGRLDVDRVREAFAGLAEGLTVLHEAGFCHRDVKPENVRVTPEGRVVLLDFGLIADLSDVSDDDAEVGTAAYMAPEQRPGAAIGPEADLYAMGVCLYEALCAKLPFEGDLPVHIMQKKRRGLAPPAPSARALHDDIPADLEALALALLDVRPEARPDAASLPARLRGETPERASIPSPSLRPVGPAPLTGRDAELTLLDAQLRQTEQGAPRVVLVEGESGIGKSALVDQWLARLKSRDPSVRVLRGRCYENEQLPYSALDGVVDELSRLLRRLRPEACEALLPPHAAVLAQLFSVLGSVRAIGSAPRKGVLAEPHARRLQGFDALRTLLRNLRAEGPLVLAIDDLQWADLESFRLLRALLCEESAPPLLLVATVRPERELSGEIAAAVADLWSWPCTAQVSIGPLSDDHARTLAGRLLGSADAELLQRVVAQANGHPLFLDELSSHARGARDVEALTLDAAVAARIDALEPSARRLLELVAVAGRPHGLQVYERALAESGAQAGNALDEALALLSGKKLVRMRKDQQLVCSHDRIRAVAVKGVAKAAWQSLHLTVARALVDEAGADPAECARLWEEGGESERAAAAYEEAGKAALGALAFRQAASLLGRALELTADDPTVRQQRTVLRAHALARGGQSAEAAALYQTAAQTAQGEERVRLGIWAAQHLLQSAQVEPGMQAARALLSELGMGLPQGEKAAIARIVWDRTRMSLRGLALKAPPKAGIDPHTALQLEAAWKLATPVAVTEVLPSANLSAEHLRRALDAGDPAHAARALAQEATMRAVQKPFVESGYRPLLETSRTLADQVGDPALDAFVTWVESMVTMLRRDHYLPTLGPLRRAEQLLREQCPDEPWLLTNVRSTLSMSLFVLGEHRSLAQQSQSWLVAAREREDRFAETTLFGMGFGFVRHLMEDDPAGALAELERTMAAWPREPFSNAGLGELSAIPWIEPYRGGSGLQRWLERERPRLGRALMLKTPFMKLQLVALSAGAALAAALSSSGEERRRLLGAVRGSLAVLKRDRVTAAGALMLEAQLLALEGRTEEAMQRAAEAVQACDALGLFFGHGAAYLQGLLEGGDAGRERRETALGFFRDQGWKHPERALAMLVPVLPELEAR